MRARAIVIAAAAILVPAAAGATPKPISPIVIGGLGAATAAVEPSRAGARPVTLTLTIEVELQCGRLQHGPIVVSLPEKMRLGASLARTAVLLDGKPSATVSLTGHSVGIGVPPRAGIVCDVMSPGKLEIVFTPAAHFGNPPAPGRYAVTIRAGGTSGTAQLVVS
jgi:hypothetical protein